MKWLKLYNESNEENQTIPVEVSAREIKLIQNYLNKDKALNEPENKECLEVVIRILNDIVKDSTIENLDAYVSNFLFENFGITMEVDPYGKNSGIQLGGNGLIEIKDCENEDFGENGAYADLIESGYWDENGTLTNGFISVEDLNEILNTMEFENGVESIQLKKDGSLARIMMDM